MFTGLLGLGVVLAGGSAARPTAAAAPGVYAFDASTGVLKTLQSAKKDKEHFNLEWSPDGRWIASTDADDFLVDVVPAAGGKVRDVESLVWSPTGTRVGYTAKNGRLYVGPSNWSKAKLVRSRKNSDVIAWAADGSRFVFGSGGRNSSSLNLARADGTGVAHLLTPPSDGPDASWINDASWSPDGKLIAVDVTVNNAVASRKGGDFLYLVDPARRVARKVQYTPGDAGFDEWSPDSKWLMVSNDDSVYKLGPKGGRAFSVCIGPCWDAVYAPNGDSFAFDTEDASGSSTLWIQEIDGSGRQHIADGVGSRGTAWSPDSRMLGFTLPGADPQHSSPAVLDPASGDVKALTDGSSREGMAGVSVGGSYAAFYRAVPPSLWVVDTAGGPPREVMTLATGQLGPCPHVQWSPTAPVLAIVNQKCEPS